MVWYGTLCVALHMTSELPGVGWNLDREENGKHFVASDVPPLAVCALGAFLWSVLCRPASTLSTVHLVTYILLVTALLSASEFLLHLLICISVCICMWYEGTHTRAEYGSRFSPSTCSGN